MPDPPHLYPMQYRNLGKTDLKLPVITFGAWAVGGWKWGGTDRKAAVEAMRAAYDAGVTAIDTAPIYGMGLSEEIVGEAIRGIPRDKVQVLTKFGWRWDLKKGELGMKTEDNEGHPLDAYKYAGKESVIYECEQSLRRLGTDYIDLLQHHAPDSTTPIDETMEALELLVQQGKVRYAGVSNYNLEQLQVACKSPVVASNQKHYSMLRREIEADIVPYAQEHGLGILAYSPLGRGLLTGKIRPGHVFAPGDHRAGLSFFKTENVERVDAMLGTLRPMAEAKGCTLGQLVLRWTMDRPGITTLLVGARNAAQAVQNAQAVDVPLDEGEKTRIDAAVDGLTLTS